MDILKLKGKIAEKGKTQIDLAKKLNLSVQSFNAKLNGRAKFDIDEAKKLIEILEIENVKEIFFSWLVPNMKQKKERRSMEREEKIEIVRSSKIRMEKLKKISGYLRDEIEIKYPELIKEDVETLISLLKLELDMAFKL